MTNDAQAAREAFEVWWSLSKRHQGDAFKACAAFCAGWFAASRSISTAKGKGDDAFFGEMLARGQHIMEAQPEVKAIVEKAHRTHLEAAAALLREVGWTVEEPRCETCGGIRYRIVPMNDVGGLMTEDCPTCNGMRKRVAK